MSTCLPSPLYHTCENIRFTCVMRRLCYWFESRPKELFTLSVFHAISWECWGMSPLSTTNIYLVYYVQGRIPAFLDRQVTLGNIMKILMAKTILEQNPEVMKYVIQLPLTCPPTHAHSLLYPFLVTTYLCLATYWQRRQHQLSIPRANPQNMTKKPRKRLTKWTCNRQTINLYY